MSAGPAVLCVAVDFGWPLEAITLTEERNTAGRLLLGIEKERSVLVLAWLLLVVQLACLVKEGETPAVGAKASVPPVARRGSPGGLGTNTLAGVRAGGSPRAHVGALQRLGAVPPLMRTRSQSGTKR
jgi:hypothetical protein